MRRNVEGLRPLGLALIRAGLLHDQTRVLLDSCKTNPNGHLTCSVRQAQQRSPQLFGIVQFWPNVVAGHQVTIPTELVQELQSVWALLPPTSTDEGGQDAIRKDIGNRGELYSYQYERLNAVDESKIAWVAQDDQNLGYDIEDRSADPRRRIEVKASGGTLITFLLSDNEWTKAHEDPDKYEVHFWGGVDLNSDAAEEYERLRGEGYPHVFVNLPHLVDTGVFEAQPTKWRVVKTS